MKINHSLSSYCSLIIHLMRPNPQNPNESPWQIKTKTPLLRVNPKVFIPLESLDTNHQWHQVREFLGCRLFHLKHLTILSLPERLGWEARGRVNFQKRKRLLQSKVPLNRVKQIPILLQPHLPPVHHHHPIIKPVKLVKEIPHHSVGSTQTW